MDHEWIIASYLAWDEDRLDPVGRRRVQLHLEECTNCRAYFEKMSLLLDTLDPSLLPTLEPEPYLPTQIRALAERRGATRLRRAVAWARVSLATLSVVVAAFSGVYLGASLTAVQSSVDDSEIIGAYYEAFSPSEFMDGWEDLIENGEEINGQGRSADGLEESS
jgi:predicted anti-sigma-YlaC factor YlaD